MPTKNKKYSRQEAIDEFNKCKDDILYFIKNYCLIQTQTQGIIPFKTWKFQDDFIRKYILGFLKTGDYKLLQVIKSRQLGMSTVLASIAVWLTNFHQGKTVAVIATDLTTAQELYEKAMIMYDNMPNIIKIGTKKRTQKEIKLKNYSRIKAYPHDKKRGIRSISCYMAFIDEGAIIEGAEDMWTAVYPAIESSGGQAIVLSTPYGPDGWFYDIYTESLKGENDFEVVRLDWTVHPDRDQKWRDQKDRAMGKRKAVQEYDAKFGISGDTYIDPDVIESIENNYQTEKYKKEGKAWIFEPPIEGEEYIAGVDCAEGGGDYQTIQIFKSSTLEQVLEYQSREDYESFGYKVFEWCGRYNTAFAVVEANSVGTSILQRLKDLNYPNIYHRGAHNDGEIVGVTKPKAGFKTGPKTRPIMIENMRKFLEDEEQFVKIRSERTLNELKVFVVKNGKPQAKSGANDDLVMSLSILLLVYTFVGTNKQSIEKSDEYLEMMKELNRNMKTNFNKFNNKRENDENDEINMYDISLQDKKKHLKNSRKFSHLSNGREKKVRREFDWVMK